MIFVTVGTHEQPFDRLVRYIDELKGSGEIQEDVLIQTGFSTYEPKHCTWSKLIPHKELSQHVKDARIIITHGGPASFIAPLQLGKIPIVFPRQKQYGEHVNDHQLDFARAVVTRQKNILMAEDLDSLGELIRNYDAIVSTMDATMTSNNARFNEEFSRIADELLGDRAL